MGRLLSFATAALCAAIAAGCGASERPVDRAARVADPAPVERTDGRLGGAVSQYPGSRPVELSRGGRPSLRERPEDSSRRDGVGAGAVCPNPVPSAGSLGAVAEATLCLLNGERADHGLAPLRANERLATAASAYAQDLVAGSYFSHTGRDGSNVRERIARTGYIPSDRGWRIGENLAWGTGELAPPASIVRAWMNSPGHRENLLNPAYREIGVGVAAGNPASRDGAGATYATTFGAIEEPEPGTVVAAPATPRKAKPRVRKARASRRGGKSGGRKQRRARAPKARIAI